MVFDILMLVLVVLNVYAGYKRGFLVSVSGILALLISFILYKIFDFGFIYYFLVYIGLSLVIAFLGKLIRKLKIPLVAKTDAILGLVAGALTGILDVTLVAFVLLNFERIGVNLAFADSSVILSFMERISLF